MMTFAIDPGTTTGWCAGRTGETPIWGSRSFADAGGNGFVLSRYHRWLQSECAKYRPGLVVFEQVYIPHQHQRKNAGGYEPPPINRNTLFRLIGFVDFTEAVCAELSIECCWVTSAEITKCFLGPKINLPNREAKKAAYIAMAHAYGWDVGDDSDAADGCAVWAKAELQIDMKAAARRRTDAVRDLEQDLRMRSAAGEATPTALKPTRRGASSNGPRQQQFTNF